MKKKPEESPRHLEYYQKNNPDWTQEQCEAAAKKFRRSSNYQCIEYYERMYPDLSHNDQVEMMKRSIEERKQTDKNNIEYYKKNYPDLSPEEQRALLHHHSIINNYQCIEYYESRYPGKTKEEYEEMRQNRINQSLSIRPDNSGENNPSHHNNTTELERRQRSPKCIEFYEKRYPERTHDEHLRMVQQHIKKVNDNRTPDKYITKPEYWIAKGYSLKDARKKVREYQKSISFTLDHCIERYGEEKGREVFENRQTKWMKSLKESMQLTGPRHTVQSSFSKNIINMIRENLTTDLGEEEYILGRYSFDYRYKDKLIEFNGDFWHMNPNEFNESDVNRVNQRTAMDIWKHDKDKRNYAKQRGYRVLTIWESEYLDCVKKGRYTKLINKCMKFLDS